MATIIHRLTEIISKISADEFYDFSPVIVSRQSLLNSKKATPSGIALMLFKYIGFSMVLYVCGLAEVSFEQALECLAVSCFVLRHFVYCVVDSVEVLLLS